MNQADPIRRGAARGLRCALLSLLLAGAAASSFSQAAPSAQEMARRVDTHYNQLRSLKADFSEAYEGMGIRRVESGTLLLRKPGRMKWEYSVPPGKLFVLDGKYAWFYSAGDPQVQRMPSQELDDLRSPLRFLLGHTELQKELSNLTLAPAPNGNFTLSGEPKGQENRIRKLTLLVTPTGVITGIVMEEADGATTRFAFTDQQPDAPIPGQTFHFVPPPGVPVVDAPPPV